MPEFESFDGLTLHYSLEGKAVGEGPPVVLLHGFAASYDANFVAPGISAALLAAGRQIIGLDARGHGQSAKPPRRRRVGRPPQRRGRPGPGRRHRGLSGGGPPAVADDRQGGARSREVATDVCRAK